MVQHSYCGPANDKQFNGGTTPLLMASQHGHAELAQLLCGARADIDKPDENCATALAWASRFGYTKVAQLLCRASEADHN